MGASEDSEVHVVLDMSIGLTMVADVVITLSVREVLELVITLSVREVFSVQLVLDVSIRFTVVEDEIGWLELETEDEDSVGQIVGVGKVVVVVVVVVVVPLHTFPVQLVLDVVAGCSEVHEVLEVTTGAMDADEVSSSVYLVERSVHAEPDPCEKVTGILGVSGQGGWSSLEAEVATELITLVGRVNDTGALVVMCVWKPDV